MWLSYIGLGGQKRIIARPVSVDPIGPSGGRVLDAVAGTGEAAGGAWRAIGSWCTVACDRAARSMMMGRSARPVHKPIANPKIALDSPSCADG
jgi:hypothetical protein